MEDRIAGVLKARLHRFMAVVTVAWLVFGCLRALQGLMPLAAAQFTAGALSALFSSWMARARDLRHLEALAQGSMGLNLGVIVLLSMMTGQGAAASLWMMAVIPLFMGYVAPVRVANGWLLAVVAATVLVYLSGRVHPLEPLVVFQGPQVLFTQITLILICHVLATTYYRTTSEQVRSLEEAEAEQRRLADQARKAAEARSVFVANMSHEVRTPLNGVLGMAELLRETPLDEQQRRLLDTLIRSGAILRGVVDDILDFSKLESGKVTLERLPFDPRKAVQDVLDLFQPQAAERGISLEAGFGPGGPQAALGDGLRYRRVVMNLVSNAIKFTSEGAVRVSLTFPEGAMRTEVRDTGIGIPADRLARIFAPFEQADASTTRLYGGTGLGLAISRSLVEAMGGRLEVDSEPGVGSTFSFQVPCEPAAELPPPVAERLPGARPMRILLVEDNPINREVVQGMLEVLGQSADVARDGVEAVEAVRRKRYDLVLMDLHMPRMDGLEATRRIRECEEGKPTRIVALTADVVPERRQALNERGITEFLPKPLSLRELASVLTPEEPPVPHRDSALDRLRQVYAGRPERFSALLQSHRANARRLETEMRAALEAGDAEVLERAAHSLKSSTAMFGSEDVSALAARVEAAARERDLAGARSVLEALPDALAEAEDRLESALL